MNCHRRDDRSVHPNCTRPCAGVRRQIDHDHVPIGTTIPRPGPGEKLTVGLIVGPAGDVEQLPVASAHAAVGDGGNERPIPGGELLVEWLIGPPRQEYGWAHPAALELALVPQRCAWKGCDRDGRCPLCPRGQVLSDARAVVVLEEADQTGLVDQIRAKVVMDSGSVRRRGSGRRAACRSKSQTLVVAVPIRGPSRPQRSAEHPDAAYASRPITVGQNSSAGGGPVRPCQVLSKTSFVMSMAMSQRIPSHCSDMSPSVSTVAWRRAGEKALSCTTSGQGGK